MDQPSVRSSIEHHLVHVITREAVGGGDQHAVDLATLYGIAQAVEPRARQHGAAIAVVAKHMGRIDDPAISGTGVHRGGKPLDLLLNGLVVDLVAGRDAAVDRYAHGTSPAGSGAPAHRPAPAGSRPPQEELVGPVPALLAGCRRHARAPDLPGASCRRMLSSAVSDLAGELAAANTRGRPRPGPAQPQPPRARQAELVICD